MFLLWVAIGSPLSAFDDASLTVHMIQHILLMLVIPPLVLLGAPSLPLLHGLPQSVRARRPRPLSSLVSRAIAGEISHASHCLLDSGRDCPPRVARAIRI